MKRCENRAASDGSLKAVIDQDATSAPYDLVVVGSGATGGWVAKRTAEAGLRIALLWASHEVGCARTGADARTSVLTPFQRFHDVGNVFVMDGSGFPSSGYANPTLTMMALAVRSTDHLLDQMKRGEL